ncbi:MAG: hypothetical protein HY704_01305 [Gemmatimonadetes bacterium]|nr:hypothetical protein [Gemmatimonadota bacterium]
MLSRGRFAFVDLASKPARWACPPSCRAPRSGLASRAGAGQGIQQWCYFNNPWEAWGYLVGHGHGGSKRTAFGSLVWSDAGLLGASILYFPLVVAGLVALAAAVW